MGRDTAIPWAHDTFNPWIGCTKVAPECDGCYAEALMNQRYHRAEWGPGKPRVRTSAANWRKPLQWHREAGARGIRRRVFCASLADVFDNEVDPAWRADLWELIEATPCLDWLLLTKRIGNARDMLPLRWMGGLPSYVWLGITTGTQAALDRDVPKLLDLPACVRWLSVEPMLEPIDLGRAAHPLLRSASVDWVVCGGESDQAGHKARWLPAPWALYLLEQCRAARVAFFMKQFSQGPRFKDFDVFPKALQVREFPA